jgi:hypothetical protein
MSVRSELIMRLGSLREIILRGILRGKIYRTMAIWPAVTQASSSLPDEQRLGDVQMVISLGVASRSGRAC